MSKEAMKLALEALESCTSNMDDIDQSFDPEKVSQAIIILREALAEQPAQQELKIDMYRSFEQWKSGNVLEHGVPRTEHYNEAQLDLVEMGWNYGYDAGRAVEQALDKKAENARELGLDYEPAQPYKGIADYTHQATNGGVRIDPVTGDVGIGTPSSHGIKENT